jgi:hypothetical protein
VGWGATPVGEARSGQPRSSPLIHPLLVSSGCLKGHGVPVSILAHPTENWLLLQCDNDVDKIAVLPAQVAGTRGDFIVGYDWAANSDAQEAALGPG